MKTSLSVLNVSAYKFMPLQALTAMQEYLYGVMEQENVMGTLLLSPEGINIAVAGPEKGVQLLLSLLEDNYGIKDLPLKSSWSEDLPFKKRFVKIKGEIIPSGKEKLTMCDSPASKKIAPQELHQWLEEERDFVLLDTRNDFEICFGTFKKAITLPLDKFRHFKNQAEAFLSTLAKDKPMVIFCTGGIRCEKGAPLLESLGFSKVYQLEGGILNYYAVCGSDFYEGECYVFDERVALNARLEATGTQQCIDCQRPVYPIMHPLANSNNQYIKPCDCYA